MKRKRKARTSSPRKRGGKRKPKPGTWLDRVVELFIGYAEQDVATPPTLRKLNKFDQL